MTRVHLLTTSILSTFVATTSLAERRYIHVTCSHAPIQSLYAYETYDPDVDLIAIGSLSNVAALPLTEPSHVEVYNAMPPFMRSPELRFMDYLQFRGFPLETEMPSRWNHCVDQYHWYRDQTACGLSPPSYMATFRGDLIASGALVAMETSELSILVSAGCINGPTFEELLERHTPDRLNHMIEIPYAFAIERTDIGLTLHLTTCGGTTLREPSEKEIEPMLACSVSRDQSCWGFPPEDPDDP